MKNLTIKNKTTVITTRYVELNNFEYTVDNLKRVRLVSYIGSKNIPREKRRETNKENIEYIRKNIESIVKEMDENLFESASVTTESRHTKI